jgi:hypothetical protein
MKKWNAFLGHHQFIGIAYGLAALFVFIYVGFTAAWITWDATFGTWHGWGSYAPHYWPTHSQPCLAVDPRC